MTSEPGTTRDWVSHHVSLNGLPIVLIDTAGHREAADALEAEAIERAVEQSRHADAQLVVIDGASGLVRLPEVAKRIPVVVAVNKADLADWRADAVPAELADWARIKTSAVTGMGREELTSALLNALGCEDIRTTGPVVFTERQENCLQRAVQALEGGNQESLDIARKALLECLHGRAEN